MSQKKWTKPSLAIGISLLIHISLGLVFLVYWNTSNQLDFGQPQDVVVYLDSTSAIDRGVSPSSSKLKTMRQNLQRRPTNITTSKPAKSAQKLLAFEEDNRFNENIIHSKVPAAKKIVTLTNKKTASQQHTIITNPTYRKWKKPVYPRRSIVKNQQGRVLVDARIDEQGRVIDLKIHQSSGYALLDRAAVKSVKKWIFEPVQHYGGTADATVRVPVNFVLAQR